MQTYIAFLRGINVSGKNLIKMADLKNKVPKHFLHFTTYIQSGNLVFASDKSITELEKELHNLILSQFNWNVEVFVYDLDFIEKLPLKNPYLKTGDTDLKRVMVTFLKEDYNEESKQGLIQLLSEGENIQFDGSIIFGYFPNAYGKAKLSNNFIEQKLKTAATTRNWNTMLKMNSLGNEVKSLL